MSKKPKSKKIKGLKNKRWIKINDRKKERYGQEGIRHEKEVTSFLENAKDEEGKNIFDQVVNHKKHGYHDRQGEDITVYRMTGGCYEKRSFGVTISQRAYNDKKNKHAAPLFCTPFGFNQKNLIKKILKLFNS